jgi:excisionase family DNA binding protein
MEELLTIDEVAAVLRLSPFTVRDLLRAKKLPGLKVGGGRQWRVRKADLEAYLNRQAGKEGQS